MNCVNINHPEFKKLLSDSGLNQEILKVKVGVWQSNNGLSNFPTLEDLNNERKAFQPLEINTDDIDNTILKFKEKNNLPGDMMVISLNKLSFDVKNQVLSDASKINKQAYLEGFDSGFNPLLEYKINSNSTLSNTEKIIVNTQNINDFKEFMNLKNINNQAQDSKLKEEMFDEDDNIQGEEQLFSPISNDDFLEDDLFDNNILSLHEWKNNRIKIKEKLEEIRNNYYKYNKLDKIKEINNLIEDLDNQINSIDTDDVNTVYEQTLEEITILSEILDNVDADPKNASNIIETSDMVNRVNALKQFFLATDITTNISYRDIEDTTNFNFYQQIKKMIPENDRIYLEHKIQSLSDSLERRTTDIVKSILINDDLIQYHLSNDKITLDDISKLNEYIENGDIDIDSLAKFFLGAYSGGGILGSLLASTRDKKLNEERGHVQERINSLMLSYKKLMSIKLPGSNLSIETLLYNKDVNGVRTNSLINRYTKSFNDSIKLLGLAKKEYYKNKNSNTYSDYMNYMKENFHAINPMKIKSIRDKYSNNTYIGKYFNQTDSDIDNYEKELIDKLGKTYFDIEIEKLTKHIDNFVEINETSGLSEQQLYIQNPFEFINNFESDNYNKADVNSNFRLDTKFITLIPKLDNKNYFNEDFSNIEKHPNSKELTDFYKDAYSLLNEYINPTLQSEGIYNNNLSLLEFETITENEIVKQLSLFGRVWHGLINSYYTMLNRYVDPNINRLNTLGVIDRKLQVGNVSYGKHEKRKLTEIYKRKSLNELYKIADKKGLNYTKPVTKVEEINFKDNISMSLAQSDINESTSMNLFDIINTSLEIAVNIRARKQTIGTLDTLKRYLAIMSKKNKNDTANNSLSNINDFLTVWADTNIYGYKYVGDISNLDKRNADRASLLTNIAKKEINFLPKNYNEAEKKLRKRLKEDLKNTSFDEEFNFSYKNIKYFKKKLNYFYKDNNGNVVKMTEKEFTKLYTDKLHDEIKELGTKVTTGSLMLGVMSNYIIKFLSENIRGGWMNRFQGVQSSLNKIASEEYNFGEKEYNKARYFLRGTNTRKYFFSDSFTKTKRGKRVQTAKMLLETLQLLQSRADDFSLQTQSDIARFGSKLTQFRMDFSINNPEWKNQAELILAFLQTVMVESNQKDNEGNPVMKPLFDGYDFIFKPGTLELKDEFDNEKNRTMWVNFENYEGKNDALLVTNTSKSLIHKTQGNYDNSDLIYAQSFVFGRLITMFKKYQFEATHEQYGTQKLDLRRGLLDVKGRKINLFEHTPTALMYILGQQNTIFTSVAASLLGASIAISTPLLLVGLGATVLPVGIMLYKSKINMRNTFDKKELLLSFDFAKEVAMRTANTLFSLPTYGKVHPFRNNISKINNKESAVKRGLTERDRKQLSENAQELASKFSIYTGSFLMSLALKSLYLMLKGPDDDEDEEVFLDKIVNVEKSMNAVINSRNSLISEIDKYTNPSAFKDDLTVMIFLQSLNNSYRYFKNIDKEQDKDGLVVATNIAKNLPIQTVLSNQVLKGINPERAIFEDERVYMTTDELDNKILKRGLKGQEEKLKRNIKDERKILKLKISKEIEKQVIEELPDASNRSIEKEVNKRTIKEMRRYNKRPSESYIEVYEELMDANGKSEEFKKYKLEYDETESLKEKLQSN